MVLVYFVEEHGHPEMLASNFCLFFSHLQYYNIKIKDMQVYFSNESCDEDQAVVSILLQTSSFSTELKTSAKFHL